MIHAFSADDATPTNGIQDPLLSENTGVASALQVFASVGGLSLLAEHLPVMYPEVSRLSVIAEEVAPKKTAAVPTSSLGNQDWVALESDELYEVTFSSLYSL